MCDIQFTNIFKLLTNGTFTFFDFVLYSTSESNAKEGHSYECFVHCNNYDNLGVTS